MEPQTYSQHLIKTGDRHIMNQLINSCPNETTLVNIAQNINIHDHESCILIATNNACGQQILNWVAQLPENGHENHSFKTTAVQGLTKNSNITTEQLLTSLNEPKWQQIILTERTITEQTGLALLEQALQQPYNFTQGLHLRAIEKALLKTQPNAQTLIILLNLPEDRIAEHPQWSSAAKNTRITNQLYTTIIQKLQNHPEEHLALIEGVLANQTLTETQIQQILNLTLNEKQKNITTLGQTTLKGITQRNPVSYQLWKTLTEQTNPDQHTTLTLNLLQSCILNVNTLTTDQLLDASKTIHKLAQHTKKTQHQNPYTKPTADIDETQTTKLLLADLHTKITPGTTHANLTIQKIAAETNITCPQLTQNTPKQNRITKMKNKTKIVITTANENRTKK